MWAGTRKEPVWLSGVKDRAVVGLRQTLGPGADHGGRRGLRLYSKGNGTVEGFEKSGDMIRLAFQQTHWLPC